MTVDKNCAVPNQDAQSSAVLRVAKLEKKSAIPTIRKINEHNYHYKKVM